MGIPTHSRGQTISVMFKLNNQSLISSRYPHKPNLCKVTPSPHAGKPLDLSQVQSRSKPKAHYPRVTGTAFGSYLKGTTEQGSTPRLTIAGSARRIEGPSQNVNRCQTNKPKLFRSQDPGFSTGVIKANSTLKA